MRLLDLVSEGPSRFVQFDDGRFLELTQELRQRIADIAAFGTKMRNKMRFAPVRALVVDELLEEAHFKPDKHWKSHLTADVDNYNLIRWTPGSQLAGKSIGISGKQLRSPTG